MRTAVLAALGLLSACAPEPDLGPRGDCNPVDPAQCILPFPSSFFLAEDPTTGSGHRLDFGPESLLVNDDGERTDPALYNEKDGFPILGSMYAFFEGVSLEGTTSLHDIGAYQDPGVLTVIVDAETGERVPHWVELDDRSPDPDRKALVLRVAAPMRHAARYVVGIRGLVDRDGEPISPSRGFRLLRDGEPASDPDVERQRDHYEEVVFPVLEDAGFARDELLLAWDLVTVSREGSLGRVVWMRDDALARIEEEPPAYEVVEVDDDSAACLGDSPPRIGLTLELEYEVPLYLETWEPGDLLTRDADGMPYHNGTVDVPLTVRVPCSVLADPHPAPLVQYGHGLLGGRSEVRGGWLSDLADRHGWILFAGDWTGMKGEDVGAILEEIGSGMSGFATVPERSMHGFVEKAVAARLVAGPLADDPLLQVDGTRLVDPDRLWFYGNSQGAILGGAYVALSPDVDRAVLGVGGGPYSLLLPRSSDFDLYLGLLSDQYGDALDLTVLVALMQVLWDPGESAGYAGITAADPLDDHTPVKPVLMQVGIGDAQVPTLGAHVIARSWDASLVDPATRDVWGLETRTPPFEGSALVEYDWGADEPDQAVPADPETCPHEDVRRSAEGQEQVRAFLEEGVVEHPCDGPCDPD